MFYGKITTKLYKMIRPEIDLELSIKALEVYGIEPNIIKSMLSNLQKVVKQNCNLQNVTNIYSLNIQEQKAIKKHGAKVVSFEKTGIGTRIKCLDAKGEWIDITDYNCW